MHGCKNINTKDRPIRTKMRNEMTNRACIELSFFPIFCELQQTRRVNK